MENSMDRGAWQATVHEVAKCQIWLSERTHAGVIYSIAVTWKVGLSGSLQLWKN